MSERNHPVPKNNRFRNFVFLAVVLLCIVVTAFGWQRLTPTAPANSATSATMGTGELTPILVQLHTIGTGGIRSELELTGNFLPQRRTLIVSEVDGVVKSIRTSPERIEAEIDGRVYSQELSVSLGHRVGKGDVLIELDPIEYQLQLDSAQARLDQAQRQLEDLLAWRRPEVIDRLQARADEAAARLDRARADHQRIQTLVDQRATSPFELDQAVAELRFSQAAVASAAADLAEAQSGPTPTEVEVARSLVAQAAAEVAVYQDRLSRTKIRAPYSGVITERFIDEGERVTTMPRVELMELIDVDILMVQVSVPERFVGRIAKEDWVQVSVIGSEQTVPGMVVLVNEKVDYETRTFRVRVGVENYDYRFKAGQFARVRFPLEDSERGLVVPAAAVVFSGGQPQVFVYRPSNQQVEQRSVQLGFSNADFYQVLAGLAEGEQVVIDDPSVLADGMRVRTENFLIQPATLLPSNSPVDQSRSDQPVAADRPTLSWPANRAEREAS